MGIWDVKFRALNASGFSDLKLLKTIVKYVSYRLSFDSRRHEEMYAQNVTSSPKRFNSFISTAFRYPPGRITSGILVLRHFGGGMRGTRFPCTMGSKVRFLRKCSRLNWESFSCLVSVIVRLEVIVEGNVECGLLSQM